MSYRVNVSVGILVDPDPGLLPLAPGVVEEVQDLLVVQLHELRGHFELRWRLAPLLGLGLPPLDPVKQLLHGPRDDPQRRGHRLGQLEARSHRVGLAGARLAVRHHSRVESEMKKNGIVKQYQGIKIITFLSNSWCKFKTPGTFIIFFNGAFSKGERKRHIRR